VAWAEAEIVKIDNTYVRVRYRGEPARLDRNKLVRSWTLWRAVYFTSSRSGYAAWAFDQMWRQRYWRPGAAPPPAMQMELAVAMKLLGVPTDFTREDIVAAFRYKAKQCHPDHGGTEAQFIELMKSRDRLLAALGTRAAAPKMPEFAPKGVRLTLPHMAPAAQFAAPPPDKATCGVSVISTDLPAPTCSWSAGAAGARCATPRRIGTTLDRSCGTALPPLVSRDLAVQLATR
jgi:hypothetical protein